MNDVRDILDLASEVAATSLGPGPKKPQRKSEPFRRPAGMARELYSLLLADGGKNLELAPLLPTDVAGGYKQKVNLGAKIARQWVWTPFTNPGRKDGAIFHHWRRIGEENREYPFAKFNKEIPIVKYSESEYSNHLEKQGWTKAETDHLFELGRRFDVRFNIMLDRYKSDGNSFPTRSLEDIKERYFSVTAILTKLRAEPGQEMPKIFQYDAEHERRRKEQLNKLWHRTPEQIEEEEFLRAELKRIEYRKREREKKTQDLQKLITAADGGVSPQDAAKKIEALKKGATIGVKKKSLTGAKGAIFSPTEPAAFYGLKWPDFKNSGITTRSGRMRLPVGIGQKKAKVVDTTLRELGVDQHPFQNEEVNGQFNELRSDIVLTYELKSILGTCEMEIQALKHQYEAMKPGETLDVPKDLEPIFTIDQIKMEPASTIPDTPTPPPSLSSGLMLLPPPVRKRKAALEQGNILRRLKNKM